MPIYEYRCSSCGHELEALQKITDARLSTCPACNQAALVKKVSAAGFQLKGSGWYATDFRGGGKPAPAADTGTSDTAKADTAKADTAKSDAAKSDAAKSDSTKSDAAPSSATKSGDAKPVGGTGGDSKAGSKSASTTNG